VCDTAMPPALLCRKRVRDGNAGPDNPQVIEVTPDKQVVWTFRDFGTFGNSMPVAVVMEP
jgi:hypothetical protein